MTYHPARHRRQGLGADAAPGGDPKIRLLQQQVNRFVPSRFANKLTVDGVMSYALATYAAGVLFDRAKAALDTYGAGEPAAGFYHKAYSDALAHVTAPLPWIAQNLATVTDEVTHYADFLGLPGGRSLISDWRVWVAAAGVGILVYGRRRRRGGSR